MSAKNIKVASELFLALTTTEQDPLIDALRGMIRRRPDTAGQKGG